MPKQSLRFLVLMVALFGGASEIAVAQSAPALAADAVIGPVTFLCDDSSEIEATFDNAPDPATVKLVRGDQKFTLPQAMSGSGARYVGDGIEFWNKGDDAMVEWQGTKLECSTAD
jgi:membrane-bound inhibitor of C-type lysozyme